MHRSIFFLNYFGRKDLLLFLFLLVNATINCQPVIVFNPVITTGLTAPLDIVNAGDGTNRIFVVEQRGNIKVFSSSYAALGTFLTVTGISTDANERGLLSMAFHPNYNTNGFFWVYYTNSAGNIEISRYKVSSSNPNQADATSRQIVLTIPHPTNTNHNGGKLNFGTDGYLYFGTGDGGSGGDPPNNAQNGNVLLGKMLRINVSIGANAPFYSIPTNNPYVTDPNVRDEIWALGLRNPFRWSFDRSTNSMWIGDVGQDAREEINFKAAGTTGGVNYGWRCYEGNLTFNTSGCLPASNYVFPVYDYSNPTPGSASVTGGIVYSGSLYPSMQGYYFANDFYSGNLYKINTNAGNSVTVQTGLPTLVAGYGEAESGELLAVSLNGSVYSVITNLPTPVSTISNTERKPIIYPVITSGEKFTIQLPTPFTQLQLINSFGAVLKKQNLNGLTGMVDIPVDNFPSGVYFIQLLGNIKTFVQKIIIAR